MKGIVLVVVMAVVVEALVEYAKTVAKMFADGDRKKGLTQLAAVIIAVLLCFATGADLFSVLGVEFAWQPIGILLTGIFGSRGANYVSDFVKKLQTAKE